MNANLFKSAAQSCRLISNLKAVFTHQFSTLLRSVEPMDIDDPKVSLIIDYIRKDVIRSSRKGNIAESMAEAVRSSIAERSGNYSYEDMMSFKRLHSKLVKDMHRILFNVIKGRGDDSYGDFIDAIILADTTIIKRILAESYKDDENDRLEGDIESAIEEADLPASVAKLIINGENYIGMLLTDGLKKYFDCYVKDIAVDDSHELQEMVVEDRLFSEF